MGRSLHMKGEASTERDRGGTIVVCWGHIWERIAIGKGTWDAEVGE